MDHGTRYSTLHPGKILRCYWYSPGLDTIIPGWTFSNLPDRARQIQRRDRVYGLPQGTILGPLFYIVYTADIETIIEKHGVKMHLYADDTQLYDHSRVNNIERSSGSLGGLFAGHRLQWSSQRRLKLNPSKPNSFWLDRAHSIGKLQQQPLIRLNSRELSSSPSVRDLGVIIDSGLTLTTHVSILAITCIYQLRRIRQAKKNLVEDAVKTLVHALVLSRLDYCNSVLHRLARSNACAAHSFPAFCCTAHSKSPEIVFRIAGNDGAPLAPTPSSNNIQIVYTVHWCTASTMVTAQNT